ncbi:MAG: PAS domain-containing protein [Ruminococcus sp.]|nr:PAS domain-containing protein [Ruminococcus sp.]
MELNSFFKSIIDNDRQAVVICDLNHTIIYMNPSAIKRYEKHGGDKLIGSSLLNCHNEKSGDIIQKVITWFEESKDNNLIYTFYNKKDNRDVYMIALRDENDKLIGYYEKHESRNRETMKFYDFK